jgi:DNA-binding NarL/FixJ family response regulator
LHAVPHVLIAADAPWIHEEVASSLPADATYRSLIAGAAVRAAVEEQTPDLVILDSQISNMGAMAVTYDLRNEESGGRLPHVPVLILLDRSSDIFLARKCNAEGYLVKPLDPIRLRRATTALLNGSTFLDKFIQADASTNYKATPDSTAR